ncbi:hypothetical protein K9K77_03605 [Candidatus Babeliales bacterium]|nr:hypothetical protein [Candidatus Babeliales bacterium]
MWKPLITILIALLAVSAFSADMDTIQTSIDNIYNATRLMYLIQGLMLGFFCWWTTRLN